MKLRLTLTLLGMYYLICRYELVVERVGRKRVNRGGGMYVLNERSE